LLLNWWATAVHVSCYRMTDGGYALSESKFHICQIFQLTYTDSRLLGKELTGSIFKLVFWNTYIAILVHNTIFLHKKNACDCPLYALRIFYWICYSTQIEQIKSWRIKKKKCRISGWSKWVKILVFNTN